MAFGLFVLVSGFFRGLSKFLLDVMIHHIYRSVHRSRPRKAIMTTDSHAKAVAAQHEAATRHPDARPNPHRYAQANDGSWHLNHKYRYASTACYEPAGLASHDTDGHTVECADCIAIVIAEES